MTFKPSQVFLHTIPPLTATMGRSEREFAAALIVRACQVRGDVFQPLTPREIGEVLVADTVAKTEPVASWDGNPFLRPDFQDLIAKGFARWCSDDHQHGPIELTEVGIEALRRWVRPGNAQPEVTHG